MKILEGWNFQFLKTPTGIAMAVNIVSKNNIRHLNDTKSVLNCRVIKPKDPDLSFY